ncbi:DNA/RNA helicase domain-containing protein [Chryseobacterium sp. JV274]|uniref:DNA/RNA helicase domain-containing protein n=1 Tax=Chryseobacterium sp. JV274 TaxID=1932669 RepID=UPI00098453F5|nr:DNA/RNA helicase domain-containing protein [Chryseobacterium sp. JV274]
MKNFTITEEYDFDHLIETKINKNHRDYLSWPIVYFLKNKNTKTAYVGETTDVLTRINTHLKSEEKKQLSSVNLILSNLFHKSATLDLESNLIKYISADGQYTLQNGNLGISNHQYHEKKVYWDLFKDIWDELRQLGISRHSLDFINNSDLFKYSPYKSLSKEQIKGLKMILNCLLDENSKVSLIHGGAGTGKSILAIFLFKLLKTNLEDFNYADFDEDDDELFLLLKRVKEKFTDLNMALVIPMASFRKTISNVFKNVNGLSRKMVIGPSDLAQNKYDLIIVDEGHRLRRRVNLGSYFGTFDRNCEKLGLDKFTASELDWVILQSNKSIIFYDQYQSIKPSDTLKKSFKKLELEPSTRVEKLKTQLRVAGGNNYIKLIHKIFDAPSTLSSKSYKTDDYEFYLFDDLSQMIDRIKKKNEIYGLSRMVAGYAWEWVSNKNTEAYDIIIGENQLKWNSISVDWINSPNSIDEVGCIHTTQGYDLNYTGVIIGPELDYDFTSKKLTVDKQKYKDKNGKNSIQNEEELLDFIINIYKTILLRGIEGTYVYACNENLRCFLHQFIQPYTTSTQEKLIQIFHTPTENSIPFYDLNIAAGSFSELQELENVKYLEVESLNNRDDYFACTVVGESMNKIIPNGSICLFKKYNGGSRNGLITLVEGRNITDLEFGSNYTIKEYSSKKLTDEEGWHHEEIVLQPKSNDSNFEPIILRDEETVDFKVLGIFVKVLNR